jgi:ABC-type nitrate/sulfonate/bicarbonate transport system ATPase subunit
VDSSTVTSIHPPGAERAKISARGLWMRFPGKGKGAAPINVLEDITLEVREGEFVCLVGPSGCGKSTFLNIAGGFLAASEGEVLIDGRPVAGPDPRRIFIFQENAVFPWLTVADNIGFGVRRPSAAGRAGLVAHYIEMVGLTGFATAYPRELSGGMRQRVEIARALGWGSTTSASAPRPSRPAACSSRSPSARRGDGRPNACPVFPSRPHCYVDLRVFCCR